MVSWHISESIEPSPLDRATRQLETLPAVLTPYPPLPGPLPAPPAPVPVPDVPAPEVVALPVPAILAAGIGEGSGILGGGATIGVGSAFFAGAPAGFFICC